MLVVILPALNEEATVAAVVKAVPRSIAGAGEVEVIVVDDGSTDGTADAAAQAGARVVRHRTNRGVGAALQTGLSIAVQAGADFAVNVDADGQFDPTDLETILAPVIQGAADMTTASRFADPALVPQMPRLKRIGNAMMSRVVSLLVRRRYHDVSCGFRAYSREAMLRLVLAGRFTYTQETFLSLAYQGLRILEVPVRVQGERSYGESRVASSLLRYALHTLGIITGAVRDYHPQWFFGLACACVGLPAAMLAIFFFVHYFVTGTFTPHLWAGFLSGALLFLAFFLFFFGQLAGMIGRLRMIQEEQLYLLRKSAFASGTQGAAARLDAALGQGAHDSAQSGRVPALAVERHERRA